MVQHRFFHGGSVHISAVKGHQKLVDFSPVCASNIHLSEMLRIDFETSNCWVFQAQVQKTPELLYLIMNDEPSKH